MFKEQRELKGAGIGLRASHYTSIIKQRPALPFVEIMADNYLVQGGAAIKHIDTIRADYPMSLHCIGMSIGSIDPLNLTYLKKIKSLSDRINPFSISDHLCFTSAGDTYLNDLMPLPHTEEAICHTVDRIMKIQDIFQTRILIENVSRYIDYTHSTIPEWEFINAIAERADCYILLDVNNAYVNGINHGFDPNTYIDNIDVSRVKQTHLSGHTDNKTYLFDTHDAKISESVWDLFARTVIRTGNIASIIEWDSDIPPLSTLLSEANIATLILDKQQYESKRSTIKVA